MSTVSAAMFSCGSCKKQYRWKPEFAGKKVKCKCGNVMTAPAQAPTAPDDQDGMYDLAEEKSTAKPAPSAPRPVASNKVTAAPRASGLAPVATATAAAPKNPMLGYASMAKKTDPEEEQAERSGAILDLWVPIGLIVVGLIASVVQLTHFDRITVSFASALPRIAIELIVGFILTGVGCLAAIKLMDIAFGAPGPAALKLTAILIFPGPIAGMAAYFMHDTSGFMQWVVGMVLFFGLLKLLFSLDLGEILLLGGILTVIRMWLGVLLAAALIGLILNGAPMPGLGAAELNSDRIAQDEIDMGHAVDAKEWFAVQGGRVFLHVGRSDCDQFMKDIFDAGAKQAWVTHSGPEAGLIIIELPSSTTGRAKIFQAESSLLTKFQLGAPSKDKGQKYLVIDF